MFVIIDRAQPAASVAGRRFCASPRDHGVIEVGYILFGHGHRRAHASRPRRSPCSPPMAFDELGYRRFEWKCDNANDASKVAAERFGFTLRASSASIWVRKGVNRDTAWYSILDGEWPQRQSRVRGMARAVQFR